MRIKQSQLWAGREEGLMLHPGLCPRILLQGAVGKGKEIQFVGSSWLDTSLWLLFLLHFLIKLHKEQDRTGEF